MSKLQHFYSLRATLTRDFECNQRRLESLQPSEIEFALLRGYLLGLDHAIKALAITIRNAESGQRFDLFSTK